MKYLVTGATGNIGSLVTKRLLDAGEKPSVLVRDATKARNLYGDRVEIRVGDLTASRDDLIKVFEGCDAIFLVNSGPDLGERDAVCASAARSAGIQHLVKLSTLDVKTKVGTGLWHARGERAIAESGVPHTFIQTAAFMSNALSWADSIRRNGLLTSSTGNGKIAFIHPDDIADVAVHVLSGQNARNAALVITGPEALSYRDMVMAIGDTIGKSVRYDTMSDTEALAETLMWADRSYAEALVDIWRAVREGRLATVSDGVHQMLGHIPRRFGDWITENIGAFAKKNEQAKPEGPT